MRLTNDNNNVMPSSIRHPLVCVAVIFGYIIFFVFSCIFGRVCRTDARVLRLDITSAIIDRQLSDLVDADLQYTVNDHANVTTYYNITMLIPVHDGNREIYDEIQYIRVYYRCGWDPTNISTIKLFDWRTLLFPMMLLSVILIALAL